jgi:hypothetical protein
MWERPDVQTKEVAPCATRILHHELLAALILTCLGIFLAIEPHLACLARRGTIEYLADGDDVLYLAIARAPYYGENQLRDPFSLPSAHVPTLFAWFQFVPLAKLARLVGLPLIQINLLWRGVGGAVFGLSLYVLFRRLMRDTRHPVAWALGCGIVCLADGGFISARWFVQNAGLVKSLLPSSPPPRLPNGWAQYRVVTPLLNLPFLLLVLATLLPKNPRNLPAIIYGALMMAICVYLYFFFWTAAVVGVGAYLAMRALLALFQPTERSEHLATVKFGACVLLGGILLGLPQIYQNTHTFADPSFAPIRERLSRPTHLTAADPARLLNLRNRWEWGALVLGALLIAGGRVRGLGLIWCMLAGAFALKNSALFTGLEFENYHWVYVTAPMGEILLLGLFARGFEKWREHLGWVLKILWVIPVGMLAIVAVFRPVEALKAEESVNNSRLLEELRPLRGALSQLPPECSLAGPPEANVALLFSPAGQLYQVPYTVHTSLISEQEIDERHALNAWLIGLDRNEYVAQAKPKKFHAIAVSDESTILDVVLQRRLKIFDQILKDGAARLLERYRPCALLLSATAPQPTRGGPWVQTATGPRWTLWLRFR